jgi:hypothetical protein
MITIFFSYLWNFFIYCFSFLFAQINIIAVPQYQQLPIIKQVIQQQELDSKIVTSHRSGCMRHVQGVRRKAKMDQWGSFMPKKVKNSIARAMGYSSYEVEFVNILKRFFNKKSNYQQWINHVGSSQENVDYINKVLEEFNTLSHKSERALIQLFHKHWNSLLGLPNSINDKSVKRLCEVAIKRTPFNVYMKRMANNFFIMYWTKDHLRIF